MLSAVTAVAVRHQILAAQLGVEKLGDKFGRQYWLAGRPVLGGLARKILIAQQLGQQFHIDDTRPPPCCHRGRRSTRPT